MILRWTRAVLLDLDCVGAYLRDRDPQAARRIMAAIRAAVGGLKQFPEIGRPGRVGGTRELVVTGTPFIVPYRVTGKYVDILRVYHGARKWPDEL